MNRREFVRRAAVVGAALATGKAVSVVAQPRYDYEEVLTPELIQVVRDLPLRSQSSTYEDALQFQADWVRDTPHLMPMHRKFGIAR